MSVQYPTSVGVSESAGRPGAQDNAPPAVAEPVATPPAMAATRDSATAANPHTARPCAAARREERLRTHRRAGGRRAPPPPLPSLGGLSPPPPPSPWDLPPASEAKK